MEVFPSANEMSCHSLQGKNPKITSYHFGLGSLSHFKWVWTATEMMCKVVFEPVTIDSNCANLWLVALKVPCFGQNVSSLSPNTSMNDQFRGGSHW